MPSPSPPLYLSLIFCFYLSLSLSLYFCPLVCVYVCACVPSVISPRVRSKFTQSQIDRNPLPKTTTKNERVLPRNVPFLPWHPLTSVVSLFKKKNTVIAAIRLWFHTSIRGVSLSNDECKICWVSLYFPLLLSWTISREPIFFSSLLRRSNKTEKRCPPPSSDTIQTSCRWRPRWWWWSSSCLKERKKNVWISLLYSSLPCLLFQCQWIRTWQRVCHKLRMITVEWNPNISLSY